GSRAATSTPRGPNESGGKDAGGEIAVATIADDGHDDRILDLRGDAQGHMQRATGRNAGEDAFFLCQPSRHLLRCSLTDRLDAVDPGTVEDTRQVGLGPLADAGDGRALLGLAAD